MIDVLLTVILNNNLAVASLRLDCAAPVITLFFFRLSRITQKFCDHDHAEFLLI